MPIYEYKCSACDFEFEVLHAMSMESLMDCPECCQPKLVKLISMPATPIVKGTQNPCRGRAKKKAPPKQRDRLGEGKNKSEKPFWRNGPVDKKILKNPEKYIREGKVD